MSKRERGLWICPVCGTMRSFRFTPMHYPADGGRDYCGGEPIPADPPEHPKETEELGRTSRVKGDRIWRDSGGGGNGR